MRSRFSACGSLQRIDRFSGICVVPEPQNRDCASAVCAPIIDTTMSIPSVWRIVSSLGLSASIDVETVRLFVLQVKTFLNSQFFMLDSVPPYPHSYVAPLPLYPYTSRYREVLEFETDPEDARSESPPGSGSYCAVCRVREEATHIFEGRHAEERWSNARCSRRAFAKNTTGSSPKRRRDVTLKIRATIQDETSVATEAHTRLGTCRTRNDA